MGLPGPGFASQRSPVRSRLAPLGKIKIDSHLRCRTFLSFGTENRTVPGPVPKEGEKKGSARQRLQGLEPLAQRLAVVLNAVFDHVRAVANLTEVAVDPLYHRGAEPAENRTFDLLTGEVLTSKLGNPSALRSSKLRR